MLVTLIWLPNTWAQFGTATYVEFEDPADAAARVEIWQMRNRGTVSDVVRMINAVFDMPERLAIRFIHATEEIDGPAYDPEGRAIYMPYEFLIHVRTSFAEARLRNTREELDQAVEDVMLHTLFHELGHALVDILELPVVGREEDAVDTLATILLIDGMDAGGEVALAAAEMFDLEDQASGELDEADFWGEHSFDAQRFYSTLCLVYGSDPDSFADFVAEDLLPAEKAETCPETFERKHQAWMTLLEPAMR